VADPAPGAVLPGGSDAPPAGAPAADAEAATDAGTSAPQDPASAVPAPELASIPARAGAAQTSLASASEPTDGGGGEGLIVAGLGTALAGASTLVVRRLRRPAGR
jgi:hypothetical protein